MIAFYHLLLKYRYHLAWVFALVILGVIGSIYLSGLLCIALLFIKNRDFKIEILLCLVLYTFLLADNFEGPFSFAQTLRFGLIGISIVVLWPLGFLNNNLSKYILPFSLFAALVGVFLSPMGIPSIIRGISYFLVASVFFKLVSLLILVDHKRCYELIFLLILVFFLINIGLYFVPVFDDVFIKGRYTGLMANPNGLGLVGLLSYALVDIIKKKRFILNNTNVFTLTKVLILIVVVLTGSRTSLFGVLLYESIVRFLKYKALMFIILTVILYVYANSSGVNYISIIDNFGLSDYLRVETLEDASGRTEVWSVAWDEIKRQPYFGKGILYDNYFILNYGERFLGEFRERHWYGIWNSYLSLLLNVGVVGLSLFMLFWYKMFSLGQMKIVRVAFIVICFFSAFSESWMAASMNAYMPLVFICWGIMIYQPINKLSQS